MSKTTNSKSPSMKKANDIILNNYYVQKSMLEKNDPRLYIIIKFIYINKGVVSRDVFTASIDPQDRLFDYDIELQLNMLKLLNLITENKILNKKFVFLTNRAIQIIEQKENISSISSTITFKAMQKMNGEKITRITTKNKELARLMNMVKYDKEDYISKLKLLNGMIYIDENISAVPTTLNLKETFPKIKTMESPKNTNGKKMINSEVFRLGHKLFYIYLNSVSDQDKLILYIRDVINFLNANFGSNLNIYINLPYSKALVDLNSYLKDNYYMYGKTKLISFNKELILFKEDVVEDAPINTVEDTTNKLKQEQLEKERLRQEQIKRERARQEQLEKQERARQEQIIQDRLRNQLQANLGIARKYLSIVIDDLISKGFEVSSGTRKDINCEVVVNYPNSLNLPVCLTLNKDIPNLVVYEEFYDIAIKYNDDEYTIKNKVLGKYIELLEYMSKTTTEKIGLFNKSKYKYTLDY